MSEALNHGWRGVLTTEPFRQCLTCGEDCDDLQDVADRENCCHCCLAAEVERLTVALAERDRCIAAALALTFPVPGDVYDLNSYTKGLADAQAAVTEALRGES